MIACGKKEELEVILPYKIVVVRTCILKFLHSDPPVLKYRYLIKINCQIRHVYLSANKDCIKGFLMSMQCLRMILGIINRDPCVSKSNRLYVDIFRFFFVKWRHNIPYFLIRRLSFMKSWTLWISNVGDTSENVVGLLYDECVQCLVYGCQVVGMVMMKCI